MFRLILESSPGPYIKYRSFISSTTCNKNKQQEDYKNNAEVDEDDLEDF